MSKDEFVLSGYEVIEKEAKPHGNGARVLVPKDWAGENVKIVRATESGESNNIISPVAALMNDCVLNDDGDLDTALSRVVKFKSFGDINNQIVKDFQFALNGNTRQQLKQRADSWDNQEVEQFYNELCSSNSLSEVTKRWTR